MLPESVSSLTYLADAAFGLGVKWPSLVSFVSKPDAFTNQPSSTVSFEMPVSNALFPTMSFRVVATNDAGATQTVLLNKTVVSSSIVAIAAVDLTPFSGTSRTDVTVRVGLSKDAIPGLGNSQHSPLCFVPLD